MSTKHDIDLVNKRAGLAALEMIGNGMDEIVRHYQDPTVLDKGSTLTLTITMTPDEQRRKYSVDIAIKSGLSARRGFNTDIYAGVDPDTDRVKAVEWDPQQLNMFDNSPARF